MIDLLLIVLGSWCALIALLLLFLSGAKEPPKDPAPVVDLSQFLEEREERINRAKFRSIVKNREGL